MKRFSGLFRLFATLIVVALAMASRAEAAPEAICVQTGTGDATKAECDVRINHSSGDAYVLARPAGGGDPVALTPFADSEQGSLAWYFLIDRSNPKRAAAVALMRQFVSAMMTEAARVNDRFAVGSFAADLRTDVDFGTGVAGAQATLENIAADGQNTALYGSVIEAIGKLAKRDSRRKRLVVLSDGQAKDSAVSYNTVVEAADKAGVTIDFIAIVDKQTDKIKYQGMELAAKDTGGQVYSVVGNTLPGDTVNQMAKLWVTQQARTGGIVTVPYDGGDAGGPLSLSLETRDGKAGSVTATVLSRAETTADTLMDVIKDFSVERAQDYIDEQFGSSSHLLLPGMLLAGLVLLGLLVGLLRKGKKKPPVAAKAPVDPGRLASTDKPASPPTPAAAPAGRGREATKALAFLDELAGSSVSHPVTRQVTKIGRGGENDIVLKNDTVHRQHCVLHQDGHGNFVLTDLNTQNGVIVNSKRTEKVQLADGDVIELGEVRLRFRVGGRRSS